MRTPSSSGPMRRLRLSPLTRNARETTPTGLRTYAFPRPSLVHSPSPPLTRTTVAPSTDGIGECVSVCVIVGLTIHRLQHCASAGAGGPPHSLHSRTLGLPNTSGLAIPIFLPSFLSFSLSPTSCRSAFSSHLLNSCVPGGSPPRRPERPPSRPSFTPTAPPPD
eukprot:GHVU01132988.1.p1 GENE.GHVU01132988.1~~GHVU01132988.1.p1  ORF type:complete len:164 (+),score=3.81 GHVU01132988.1:146-637(+)